MVWEGNYYIVSIGFVGSESVCVYGLNVVR
jgi:hypothetical protein